MLKRTGISRFKTDINMLWTIYIYIKSKRGLFL